MSSMTDFFHFLLAMGVLMVPMGLAWWLLSQGRQGLFKAKEKAAR
jgi:hypothetical protein